MDITRRTFLAGMAAAGVKPNRRKRATVAPGTVQGRCDVPRVDVTLHGPLSVAALPATIDRPVTFGAPTVLTPASSVYHKVASVHKETAVGDTSLADGYRRMLALGYTGIVHYLPSGTPTSWNSDCASLASTHGTQNLMLQLTAKTHSDSGLQSVLASLPDPWRASFRYNIWQEPTDDWKAGAFTAATYKGWYASAAAVIRTWNAANPTKAVDLPWCEFTEFSVGRKYDFSDFTQDPVNLRPATGDYGGILWSFFDYGDNGAGTDTPSAATVSAQVAHVTRSMTEDFTGKPWGIMAAAYTLEMPASFGTPDPNAVDPYTTTQKQNQALWLTQSYNQLKAAGSTCYGWFNIKEPGTQGSSGVGEGRVEKIAETLAAFNALT